MVRSGIWKKKKEMRRRMTDDEVDCENGHIHDNTDVETGVKKFSGWFHIFFFPSKPFKVTRDD